MLRHVSLEERPIVVLDLRGGLLGANPIPHRSCHDRAIWHEPEKFSSELNNISLDPVDCHDYPSRRYHVISCVDYIPHLLSTDDEKDLDQVGNTLAFEDRGQGLKGPILTPCMAGGPFQPLVEPDATSLHSVGVGLSTSQPPTYTVEDGIRTQNP
ncbi:hypothetical protein Tco_0533937 [Tanacetum coccineum]